MRSKRVSVGISAYNEEKNIKNVLRDILSQNQNGWKLKEILVYCDGCTDKTAENVMKIKNRHIKLVNDGRRAGKTKRVGQIFHEFDGDYIVMFDADIRLSGRNIINNLMDAFDKNPNIRLVGGNSIPFFPKTFFEKANYSTFMVFYQSRTTLHCGQNIFGCTGHCLALRRDLAREIKFPKIMNEDVYIYLFNKSMGYDFYHVHKAVVYYKLPTKLSDYLKQIFRSNPEAVHQNFERYFDKLVSEEYRRPFKFYAAAIFKVFLEDPLPTMYIIIINIIAQPFYAFITKRYKVAWPTAQSTK